MKKTKRTCSCARSTELTDHNYEKSTKTLKFSIRVVFVSAVMRRLSGSSQRRHIRNKKAQWVFSKKFFSKNEQKKAIVFSQFFTKLFTSVTLAKDTC